MKPRRDMTDAASLRLSREVAQTARVGVIRSNFHREMSERLEQKCVETLVQGGLPRQNIDRVVVPGCFEIPFVAQRLAATQNYSVLIALGVVVRGDTYHFELVANECARGVMQVSLANDIPIIFEVLAVYRLRDAARRSANNSSNKGIEAAHAALQLLQTMREIARKK